MLQGVSQRVLDMSGGGGVGVAGVLEDVVHQNVVVLQMNRISGDLH